MMPIEGIRTTWLVIETSCFYLYLMAAVFYILWRGVFSSCCETGGEASDMYKALTDFIGYSSINLTWFSFNFVLISMPPLCMFVLQTPNQTDEDDKGSYMSVMYTLWAMHVFSFFIQKRIFVPAEQDKKISAGEVLSAAFDKDD